MSEYWVSKKRYFCKYCEIYIADDAPSRQQHENGLRHKGNVERFIRSIYKQGEKNKKDQEDERREMLRVEKAAQAAFAEDVGAGRAKLSAAPTPPAASSSKPPPKPSNPYVNYSSAASLGYSDPDADRLAADAEIRRSQGVAGEWEIITTTPGPATPHPQTEGQTPDLTPDAPTKREADGPPPEEDTRMFKLKKKTVAPGLGQIYDPGIIPIKLKKKEEPAPEPTLTPAPLPSTSSELPKWTSIQLKPLPLPVDSEALKKEAPTSVDGESAANKWTKVQWDAPIPDVKREYEPLPKEEVKPPSAEQPEVKQEEDVPPPAPEPPSGGSLFKKRKTPAGAGRGRR